jgi:5-formyltetrahydrofolate cyclo-ligase
MTNWQGSIPDKPQGAAAAMVLLKKKMRQELRQRMRDTTADSAPVRLEVEAFLRERSHLRVVAIFSPLPGEVDLISLTRDKERTWVFPSILGNSLAFHEIKDPEKELQPGAFGIPEPINGLPVVPIHEIDLFLCPGLGFDTRGGRIGRGKGFYDGILANARPNAIKLGVCFQHQIVDEIIMEEHDIRMNEVIAG